MTIINSFRNTISRSGNTSNLFKASKLTQYLGRTVSSSIQSIPSSIPKPAAMQVVAKPMSGLIKPLTEEQSKDKWNNGNQQNNQKGFNFKFSPLLASAAVVASATEENKKEIKSDLNKIKEVQSKIDTAFKALNTVPMFGLMWKDTEAFWGPIKVEAGEKFECYFDSDKKPNIIIDKTASEEQIKLYLIRQLASLFVMSTRNPQMQNSNMERITVEQLVENCKQLGVLSNADDQVADALKFVGISALVVVAGGSLYFLMKMMEGLGNR